MSSVQLLEFFENRRILGTPMVLVTVIETSGSTYPKPGQRILIDEGGQYCGLVSGGCLEGDLVVHARDVFRTRAAAVVTYDLRGDEDELWGLGIGCNGMFRLLLQLLDKDNHYEPMRSIAISMVTRSDHMIAISLVTRSLGWLVALADHRREFVNREEFGAAQRLFWPDERSIRVGLRETHPTAVVIMTHNLQADARYLRLLANSDCMYIGLLGPKHRRTRLLETVSPALRGRIEERLHGPIGMAIGADSAASIALSIIAELFTELKKRDLQTPRLGLNQHAVYR